MSGMDAEDGKNVPRWMQKSDITPEECLDNQTKEVAGAVLPSCSSKNKMETKQDEMEAKQDERPVSPSCLPIKSDDMEHQLSFNQGAHDTQIKREMSQGRAVSPTSSHLSMRSNHSMGQPIHFKGERRRGRSESPTSSSFSMKSTRSMDQPISFKGKMMQGRAVSPTASYLSMRSNQSMETPILFKGEMRRGRSESPTSSSPSMKSNRSMDKPICFKGIPRSETTQLSSEGALGQMNADYNSIDRVVGTSEFPQKIDDWSTQHVREWLIKGLKVPERVAQILHDQDVSGGSLVCFEKKDLIDLGITTGPAIQIIKHVQKLQKKAESLESNAGPSGRIFRAVTEQIAEVVGKYEQTPKVDTVVSDSDTQSMASSWTSFEGQGQSDANQSVMLVKMPLATSAHMAAYQSIEDNVINIETLSISTGHTKDTAPHSKRQCLPCPFDTNDISFTYTQDDILPPAAGLSNLLDPVHEYKLLPEEISEREILYEFSKEVFCFAASCMNSRTNGTIHFGVNGGSGNTHGKVVGQNISSVTEYIAEFDLRLEQHFEENVRIAKACVRPPKFFQILSPDGTTSDKYVIEVDVVPRYSETHDKVFYTYLHIASEGNYEESKKQCLFVRQGPKSINVLADSNPRILQEMMRKITKEVKAWASTRKSKEEEKKEFQNANPNQEGLRLKQLITRGRDVLENSQQFILVTNKCHPSQLEHLGFLKEIKLFAVLDFDPESDKNGTCNFYKKDRIANQHYPRLYSSQDNVSNTIGKMNLFKQTSWVFCNGRANEESESDKPFTTSDWLKKRAGEISHMVSFLCNPDMLSKERLLVIFLLHSVVNDISNPILETFCAIYRTLGGEDNMLCICKDSSVFTQWRELIKTRCEVDITSKCFYELNLNEIDCTIRKLKEPQARSSRRYLPSTGSSSVLLTKRDEELMTVLDILSENECENTEIETNKSFKDFQKETEEDFYRGGQVTWWNFYLSERPGCLPFIKRDNYNDLYNLITPTEGYTSPCVMINLFHHPGCGGTTMAMHALWSLRGKFRCAVLKNNIAQNSEVAVQVTYLLNCGKQEQSRYTPVLLLVDNWEDVEDLQRCILIEARKKTHKSLTVIILNCERTQFPAELSRNSMIANVFITNKLSTKEQSYFEVKLKDLEIHHEKPETFYAFMIMTNNFSEQYIENLVCNTLKDLDDSSKEGKLLSFLAMLNTYVNGSCMSLSLCEELVGIRNALWGRETLEEKMNPYSTLLIRFTVEEHGTYQTVRFLHQMIASNCLQVFTRKHKLLLSEITTNLLHCDILYKSGMGKDILVQNIQRMLITRNRKELGNDKDTLFSPLIEDIQKDEGTNQIKEVLERATERFVKNATVPQALARHFYLKEKDFPSALRWAQDAKQKRYNSYIADTLGQVHKSQLKYENELAEELTPEALDICLKSASKAIKAFNDSQELAKKDEIMDSFDQRHRKRQRSYNTSGYVGEMDVTMILFDVIKDIPFFNKGDIIQKDRMLQFLKGHLPVSDFHEKSTGINDQFIAILANHERFLVSLRPRMKDIFCFFENYFTYLKPRSIERETADDRNKRKVSEHFKRYMQIFCESREEKASEKASKPHLSLRQEIDDQRRYLEEKRADSFAGLLQMIDQSSHQMEFILKKWQFLIANSTRKTMSDTVNFILANIVLHCMKPNSKLVKRYEELLSLLNEALQEEGIRSNCTELYYLSMLLMWPNKDNVLESTTTFKNISTYVTSVKKSFHRRFSYMFPARSAISHFFLGKSKGLKRIISKGRLDQALNRERPQTSQFQGSSKDRLPNPHQLWQSGAIWKEPQVQNLLLRVKGKTENGEIYVHYGGNQKIPVRPVYLGGVRTGCSLDEVSFYLGFSMEGPVAYDVNYENDM